MTVGHVTVEVVDLLAELSAAAPVGAAILDQDLRFLWVNPLMAEINGRPVEEHAGRTLEEVLGDLTETVAPYLRQVLDTGAAVRDVRICADIGGRPGVWEANYFPLGRRGAPAVGGVVTDITERVAAEGEARVRVSQQAAVGRLGRRALERAGLQELLDLAVTLLSDELSVECAKVLELESDGDRLLLRAGCGWRAGLVGRARVPAGDDSQAGYTLLSDEPVVVVDLATEARFTGPALLDDHGIVSGLSVVIRTRGGPWGVLGAHTAINRRFTHDDIAFLHSLANVLGVAIDRDSADRELERTAAQRRRLIAAALTAGEHERALVADRLHDDVLQTLLFARQECASASTGDDGALARATQALQDATDQIRAIIGAVHPVTHAHAGLGAAIALLAREEAGRGGFAVTLDVDERADGPHAPMLISLTRELLTNVTKHAQATRVTVSLQRATGTVLLAVTDNGQGAPTKAFGDAVARGHIGLASAIERVEVIGGTLEITSSTGEGTAVLVSLPTR